MSTGRVVARGRRVLQSLDERAVPSGLRSRWVAAPEVPGLTPGWRLRLHRDRVEIVPWLNRTAALDGARILEVGAGEGAACVAMAEQGASVLGIDIDADAVERGRALCAAAGLPVELRVLNADRLHTLEPPFDWVIFWASLEHMVLAERIDALRQAWALLPGGGLLTIIETPNRLWPHDSHTSQLPFFCWLPDDLAFRFAARSPRAGFGADTYTDADSQMLHFLRRGRGFSFHEVDLALGAAAVASVVSSLQLERRRRMPLRGAAWWLSRAGRTERVLLGTDPVRHRAWFQPFLYLTLRKP